MSTVTTSTIITVRGITPDRASIEIMTTTTIGDKTYKDDPIWYNWSNSESGRARMADVLQTDHPDYYNAVLALWGDTPTVEEPAAPSVEEAEA